MEHVTDKFSLYNGDCVQIAKQMPNDSIHFSIFSPPFANLYIYSDDLADMGNCKNHEEFFNQFDYLLPELLRITVPGRLCAVHCKDLVKYKGRDGVAGLYDFSGDIIRHFIKSGWEYHSKIVVWKDPVVEMQRTKAHGLLWKQLRKDSSYSRQGIPDIMLIFRKWGEADKEPVTHTEEDFPVKLWQKYASPVWFDINQTNVLNIGCAREDKDTKHICPLQLDVIERCIELWTNKNDVVFTPFLGIGSEIYQAVKMGRRGIGVELKQSYYEQAVENCEKAEQENKSNLFAAFSKNKSEE